MTNTIDKIMHNGSELRFNASSVSGITTTQPSNPSEGAVYYDTVNDVIKVYDGTNWVEVGKEYNAGEGIEIGAIQDYSAMQGPAPDGFHVPLTTEWQAVYDIWTALGGGGSDGTNFGIALKLPFAGRRSYSSADVIDQGTYGCYWSSSRDNAIYAYYLNFRSTALYPHNNYYRAYGFSVRCFKNTPTIPTSSWTKLYGTSIETGGIFWSSTDGLISLSSDGQTWVTIQDKNLGATTVWNSGDTLSEANCGKYYQRGNNYGFAGTGTVTTSSTQVDASNYGPGNYYSSDTFIMYSGRWDSTDNGNLWGGVTGVVTLDNAITNTGVLSVNGQTGDVTIPTAEESNTKTFYLSSTSDLTTAQAAYDWYLAGKNPIVLYQNKAYIVYNKQSTLLDFSVAGNVTHGTLLQSSSRTLLAGLQFYLNSNTVTGIDNSSHEFISGYLEINKDYSTPYIPQYNGSPATKKYVDDTVASVKSSGSTAPSNPTEGQLWYDTTNDVLKVYDGTNWIEVGGGGGVEVFDITQYGTNTDWTDIITSCANNNTLTIILDIWEDDYTTQTGWVKWLVTEYDDGGTSGTGRISAIALFNLNGVGSAVPYPKSNKLVATFNATTKYCTGVTRYYTEFVPTNSGSTGNVLTKTANGYEWSAPNEPTVISGDSGTTYTIKVSSSAPASGTPNTTITFVI